MKAFHKEPSNQNGVRDLKNIGIILSLAVVGCGNSVGDIVSPDIEAAKEAAAYDLLDPDSAKFRNVVEVEDGVAVCGEINGKNAYNAYTGYKPFSALKLDDGWSVTILEGDDSIYERRAWYANCAPDEIDPLEELEANAAAMGDAVEAAADEAAREDERLQRQANDLGDAVEAAALKAENEAIDETQPD